MNKNKETIKKMQLDTLTFNGKVMEFDHVEKSGKVKHFTVKNLLVNGNDKIGKNVWHFSTLAAMQDFFLDDFNYNAKGTCFCKCEGCYGLTGNYRYETTKRLLAYRTMVARENLDLFVERIIAEIRFYNIEFVRIHATGDFFSKDYVKAWIKIAKACKTTKFWTYTKAFGHGFDKELNALTDLDNVNIVNSIVPGCGFNFGHIDYVIATYYELKNRGENPYICRCGIDKEQHCNNCKGCSCHKYVLFVEHSTGYKAEKDPLYKKVVELIESQPKQD